MKGRAQRTDRIWGVGEESGTTPNLLAWIMRIELPQLGSKTVGRNSCGQERRSEELSLGQVTSEMPVSCSNKSTAWTVANMNFGFRRWVQVGDISLGIFRSDVAHKRKGPSKNFRTLGQVRHTQKLLPELEGM